MPATKGVALVTGASQGIGRAIALRLADDGFDVAINGLPPRKSSLDILSREIQEKGRKAHVVIGDVSVEDEVKAMVASAVEVLGGLDVMVANAGITITKSVLETTVEDWDRMFSVNAFGVFLCYKYAGQQMVKQGRGGRLISASSVVGRQGESLLGAYSASKFAVRGLTQATAKELGPHAITVNAYAPGAIDTNMLKEFGEVLGDVEAVYEGQRKLAALNCIGSPADIASAVSYLASKEAHFITGQTFSVDGGRFFD